MSQSQEVLEGNRLIAEFMGYRLVDLSSPFLGKAWRCDNIKNPLYQRFEGNSENDVWFHKNYEWLMLAIDYIESMDSRSYSSSIKSFMYEKNKNNYRCEFFDNSDGIASIPVISVDGKNKIRTIMGAIIQFINFYNQTQKR